MRNGLWALIGMLLLAGCGAEADERMRGAYRADAIEPCLAVLPGEAPDVDPALVDRVCGCAVDRFMGDKTMVVLLRLGEERQLAAYREALPQCLAPWRNSADRPSLRQSWLQAATAACQARAEPGQSPAIQQRGRAACECAATRFTQARPDRDLEAIDGARMFDAIEPDLQACLAAGSPPSVRRHPDDVRGAAVDQCVAARPDRGYDPAFRRELCGCAIDRVFGDSRAGAADDVNADIAAAVEDARTSVAVAAGPSGYQEEITACRRQLRPDEPDDTPRFR